MAEKQDGQTTIIHQPSTTPTTLSSALEAPIATLDHVPTSSSFNGSCLPQSVNPQVSTVHDELTSTGTPTDHQSGTDLQSVNNPQPSSDLADSSHHTHALSPTSASSSSIGTQASPDQTPTPPLLSSLSSDSTALTSSSPFNSTTTATANPPSLLSNAKKFKASSLSVNKKFLSQSGTVDPKSVKNHFPARLSSLTSSAASSPLGSGPRLLTGKIGTNSSILNPSGAVTSGWAKPPLAAPSLSLGSKSPDSNSSGVPTPAPNLAKPLGNRDESTAPLKSSGLNGLSSHPSPQLGNKSNNSCSPWGKFDHSGGQKMTNLTTDFPTAQEVAQHTRLKAQSVAAAVAARDKAVQDRAAASAAYNQQLLQTLDGFRGTHLDPNASHWDEMEDEDDMFGEVVEFGDGTQYKVTEVPAIVPDQNIATPTSSEPPVKKEERFAEDYDRTSEDLPPFLRGRAELKSLFNERLGKFEPYSGKPKEGPGHVQLMQRQNTDGGETPPPTSSARSREPSNIREETSSRSTLNPLKISKDHQPAIFPQSPQGSPRTSLSQPLALSNAVIESEPSSTGQASIFKKPDLEQLHRTEMLSAAERARKRRQEEEEAREKERERARQKALEIELKLKAAAEEEAKRKAEHEAKVKAERDAKIQAEQEAKAKAEQEAKAKAEQEAKIRAEQETRLRLEKEHRLRAEHDAKSKTVANTSNLPTEHRPALSLRRANEKSASPSDTAESWRARPAESSTRPGFRGVSDSSVTKTEARPTIKAGTNERPGRAVGPLPSQQDLFSKREESASTEASWRKTRVSESDSILSDPVPSSPILKPTEPIGRTILKPPAQPKPSTSTTRPTPARDEKKPLFKLPQMSHLDTVMSRIKGVLDADKEARAKAAAAATLAPSSPNPVDSAVVKAEIGSSGQSIQVQHETDSGKLQGKTARVEPVSQAAHVVGKTRILMPRTVPDASPSKAEVLQAPVKTILSKPTTQSTLAPALSNPAARKPSAIRKAARFDLPLNHEPKRSNSDQKLGISQDNSDTPSPTFTNRDPLIYFDITRPQRPSSPGPAWKAFTVKLGESKCRSRIPSHLIKAFWNPAVGPAKVNVLSWEPPLANLSPRTLSRDELLFRKKFIRGIVISQVQLPTRRIDGEDDDEEEDDERLKSGKSGAKSGENLIPVQLKRASDGPLFMRGRGRGTSSGSPSTSSLRGRGRGRADENNSWRRPAESIPSAVAADVTRDDFMKLAEIETERGESSSRTTESSKRVPKLKIPEGVKVAFNRPSHVVTPSSSASSGMFMVSSEITGETPAPINQSPSSRSSVSGDAVDTSSATLTPRNRPCPAPTSLTPPSSTIPSMSGSKGPTSPWTKSPLAFSVLDSHTQNVWSQPDGRISSSGRVENSLKGIADDFPAALPRTLNDFNAEEEPALKASSRKINDDLGGDSKPKHSSGAASLGESNRSNDDRTSRATPNGLGAQSSNSYLNSSTSSHHHPSQKEDATANLTGSIYPGQNSYPSSSTSPSTFQVPPGYQLVPIGSLPSSNPQPSPSHQYPNGLPTMYAGPQPVPWSPSLPAIPQPNGYAQSPQLYSLSSPYSPSSHPPPPPPGYSSPHPLPPSLMGGQHHQRQQSGSGGGNGGFNKNPGPIAPRGSRSSVSSLHSPHMNRASSETSSFVGPVGKNSNYPSGKGLTGSGYHTGGGVSPMGASAGSVGPGGYGGNFAPFHASGIVHPIQNYQGGPNSHQFVGPIEVSGATGIMSPPPPAPNHPYSPMTSHPTGFYPTPVVVGNPNTIYLNHPSAGSPSAGFSPGPVSSVGGNVRNHSSSVGYYPGNNGMGSSAGYSHHHHRSSSQQQPHVGFESGTRK